MNKIEALKAEKDGLDIRSDITRFAANGWESIPEDDVQRLKWYGLFLRNPTPGYFMLRVRIPGGRATSAQLRTLAMVANTLSIIAISWAGASPASTGKEVFKPVISLRALATLG